MVYNQPHDEKVRNYRKQASKIAAATTSKQTLFPSAETLAHTHKRSQARAIPHLLENHNLTHTLSLSVSLYHHRCNLTSYRNAVQQKLTLTTEVSSLYSGRFPTPPFIHHITFYQQHIQKQFRKSYQNPHLAPFHISTRGKHNIARLITSIESSDISST